MGPYGINAFRNGVLTGHTATVDSSNLIVENIMMNDVRNGSEYSCVVIPAQGMATFADIIYESVIQLSCMLLVSIRITQ